MSLHAEGDRACAGEDEVRLIVALAQVRRWIARTIGILLVVGEGLPNPNALSLPEILLFVVFLAGVFQVPTHPATLFHLCFTEVRRPGEGEDNHLLASFCADVVVHGHDLDAGDLFDHRLQDRPCGFNQMGPNLLQQVPPLFGGMRLDPMLLGCNQDALQANDEEIAEQAEAWINLGPRPM